MAITLPPDYVVSIDWFFIFASTDFKRTDGTEIDLSNNWLVFEAFSVWLGCHATDSIRLEFDKIAGQVKRGAVDRRGARYKNDLKTFHSLWSNIKRAYNIPGDELLLDGDGVDPYSRSMTWGGKKFTGIPKRAIAVIELFLENYRYGREVYIWEIERIASVAGGMKSQVFKCRGGIHPVAEIIISVGRGKYRLCPPSEVTD